MRVGIAGLFHETNTFSRGTTVMEDFLAYQYAEGEEILAYETTRSEIGGFLAGARTHAWSIRPAVYAAAVPSGVVDQTTYESIVDRMLARLFEGGSPDAILLTLHGAMATTADDDPDGTLVQRVVSQAGRDVPIVVTIDLHANVSDRMTAGIDSLIGYDTYPHVDMFERGREAVEVVSHILATGQRQAVAHRKLPLLTVPLKQGTADSPMAEIMAYVHELEAREGVIISVAPGFPYADTECAGVSVTVSGPDRSILGSLQDAVGNFIWERRDLFDVQELVPVHAAVDMALATHHSPVILVDSADNIGGGSPGDGTAILGAWLARGGQSLIVTLADPESVGAAVEAGVGSTVQLTLGGKTDDRHGPPVPVEAYVKTISDGVYEHYGSYNRGFVVHMGRTVVLDLGGNIVVVSERKAMPFDAQQLFSLGVDPRHHRALVVKSAVAWKAAFGDVAATVIHVDTPGVCTNRLSRFSYSLPRRQMLLPFERPEHTEIHQREDSRR